MYDATILLLPQLEVMLPAEIPDNRDICGICRGCFAEEGDYACLGGGPRKLPCGHIFGHTCITTALFSSPRCPLCRNTYQLKAAPNGTFMAMVLQALFVDCMRVKHPGFTPNEQLLRTIIFLTIIPLVIVVTVTMGLGPQHEPNHPLRTKGMWMLCVVFYVLVTAPAAYAATLVKIVRECWSRRDLFWFARVTEDNVFFFSPLLSVMS